MLPTIKRPLQVPPDILRQLPQKHPKQPTQQRPRHIQPLLPEMIPIILTQPPEPTHEQLVARVTQKVNLARLAVRLGADVGQQLLLQDSLGVVHAVLAGHVLEKSVGVSGEEGGEREEQ